MIGKHYYAFSKETQESFAGKKLDRDNWEKLRSGNEKEFYIESSAGEYEQNCLKKTDYENYAKLICNQIIDEETCNIISYGIGKGILEYHIKRKLPDVSITLTDYTKNSLMYLEQLVKSFSNVNTERWFFKKFDLLKGEYKENCNYDYHVMFRLSTEFTHADMKNIFLHMAEANINRIIFVPAELATLKIILHDLKKHYIRKIRKQQDIFCGYHYSESEFYKVWKLAGYTVSRKIPVGDSAIFLLEK